jgi:uncharacterized protein YbjT (DUF2867 family)
MKASIVGATGATGKDLLKILLEDDDFDRVDIFVRRDVDQRHDKLNVHVIDFDKTDEWKDLVKGDVLFSCLGTTLKAAGSKEAQWRIDYDYQYEFAKAARENGVDNYVLVSSSGASPNSFLFYPKMKGQLEEAVKRLGFSKLSIFNPPILERMGTDRSGEVLGLKVIRFANRLGLFRSQRPMPTEVLARAMVNAAKKREVGVHSYSTEAIWKQSQDLSI